MSISLFQGELVRLAAPNPETDAEMEARWQRDSEFLRLADSDPARPLSVSQNKKDMEARAARDNAFPFIIRSLADDRPIGFVSLWVHEWAHREAWMGIGLGDRDYWGKGYGTDAVHIIVRFGFTELNLHRVSLGVFDYNPRAIRAYEKAGFVLEGRTRHDTRREGRFWDSLWMGLLREEWERLNAGGRKLEVGDERTTFSG